MVIVIKKQTRTFLPIFASQPQRHLWILWGSHIATPQKRRFLEAAEIDVSLRGSGTT